jgi:hypothetical protein
MDLFKKLKKQNEETRKGCNPFKGTICCGGRPSKKKTNKGYNYTAVSEDDPINF